MGIFGFEEMAAKELDMEEEAKTDNADFEQIDVLDVEDSDAIISGPEDLGCDIGKLSQYDNNGSMLPPSMPKDMMKKGKAHGKEINNQSAKQNACGCDDMGYSENITGEDAVRVSAQRRGFARICASRVGDQAIVSTEVLLRPKHSADILCARLVGRGVEEVCWQLMPGQMNPEVCKTAATQINGKHQLGSPEGCLHPLMR